MLSTHPSVLATYLDVTTQADQVDAIRRACLASGVVSVCSLVHAQLAEAADHKAVLIAHAFQTELDQHDRAATHQALLTAGLSEADTEPIAEGIAEEMQREVVNVATTLMADKLKALFKLRYGKRIAGLAATVSEGVPCDVNLDQEMRTLRASAIRKARNDVSQQLGCRVGQLAVAAVLTEPVTRGLAEQQADYEIGVEAALRSQQRQHTQQEAASRASAAKMAARRAQEQRRQAAQERNASEYTFWVGLGTWTAGTALCACGVSGAVLFGVGASVAAYRGVQKVAKWAESRGMAKNQCV